MINIEVYAPNTNEVFLRAYNILGHIVLEKNMLVGNNPLDLVSLSNGVYFFDVMVDHPIIASQK